MDKRALISVIAIMAFLLALIVLGTGVTTRLVDAGLGCPDWPVCYGHIVAPLSAESATKAQLVYPNTPLEIHKAWMEMVHRYVAGTLGLFIISLVVMIFCFSTVRRDRFNQVAGVLILGLLAYQVILGMWTVTLKLMPIIVSQHLLVAMSIISLLWLFYWRNRKNPTAIRKVSVPLGLKLLAFLAVIMIFLQNYLGVWTSSNYAALSCSAFPVCHHGADFITLQLKQAFDIFSPVGINYDGGVLSQEVRQSIQMIHRIGALIVTIYLFLLALTLRFNRRYQAFSNIGNMILALLLVQVSLGISNVLFKLPLAIAISHSLVATALLVSVVTLFYQIITGSNTYERL